MRNDIYMTAGQVPEIIMTGNTADISHIAEFGCYDWVMFYDTKPSYLDDRLLLGHYLGPAINTESALTAKILQQKGVFVCRLTLRHFTDEELHSTVPSIRRYDASFTHQLTNILDRRLCHKISLQTT
jgi:hypothetical protein